MSGQSGVVEIVEVSTEESNAGLEMVPFCQGQGYALGVARPPRALAHELVMVEGEVGEDKDKISFWVDKAIAELAAEAGMQLLQKNGQRSFGPELGIRVVKPAPGTEVFVTKIPRNCSELDLFPLFEAVGRVYQIRIMLDFSGYNRGFCFVRYYRRVDAEKAIKALHGWELMRGNWISVLKSFDNCLLQLTDVPKDKTNDELRTEIMRVSRHVAKVMIVVPSDEENLFLNRYCLVMYATHRAASVARRGFLGGDIMLWGKVCMVEWGQIQIQLTTVLLRNVPGSINTQGLWELCVFASKNQVFCVTPGNFGYEVEFRSQQAAEKAVEAICRIGIHGNQIFGVFVKALEPRIFPFGRRFRNGYQQHRAYRQRMFSRRARPSHFHFQENGQYSNYSQAVVPYPVSNNEVGFGQNEEYHQWGGVWGQECPDVHYQPQTFMAGPSTSAGQAQMEMKYHSRHEEQPRYEEYPRYEEHPRYYAHARMPEQQNVNYDHDLAQSFQMMNFGGEGNAQFQQGMVPYSGMPAPLPSPGFQLFGPQRFVGLGPFCPTYG